MLMKKLNGNSDIWIFLISLMKKIRIIRTNKKFKSCGAV